MTIEVDTRADAAYVTVRDEEVAATRKLDANRLVDLDASGEIIGIEFLHVSGGVDLRGLPHREQLHELLDQHHIRQFA